MLGDFAGGVGGMPLPALSAEADDAQEPVGEAARGTRGSRRTGGRREVEAEEVVEVERTLRASSSRSCGRLRLRGGGVMLVLGCAW